MRIIIEDGRAFARVLRALATHASADEARANLTCIHVEADERRADFVATDGHRIALYRLAKFSTCGAPYETEGVVDLAVERLLAFLRCVPSARKARSSASPITIDLTTGTVAYESTVADCGVDVKFPPYRDCIPENCSANASASLDAGYLAQAADAFRAVSGCQRVGVRIFATTALGPAALLSEEAPELLIIVMPRRTIHAAPTAWPGALLRDGALRPIDVWSDEAPSQGATGAAAPSAAAQPCRSLPSAMPAPPPPPAPPAGEPSDEGAALEWIAVGA